MLRHAEFARDVDEATMRLAIWGLGVACAAGVVSMLVACAAYGPAGLPVGSSSARAIERLGTPSGRYENADRSKRLEFARGPMGRHTYMLDFDADDRLVRAEQVLTERNFHDLQIGMAQGEVLRRVGRPSDVSFLSRQRHQLWSYRYETPFCIWFQVSIDTVGRVAELGHNADPLCDARDDRQ